VAGLTHWRRAIHRLFSRVAKALQIEKRAEAVIKMKKKLRKLPRNSLGALSWKQLPLWVTRIQWWGNPFPCE